MSDDVNPTPSEAGLLPWTRAPLQALQHVCERPIHHVAPGSRRAQQCPNGPEVREGPGSSHHENFTLGPGGKAGRHVKLLKVVIRKHTQSQAQEPT